MTWPTRTPARGPRRGGSRYPGQGEKRDLDPITGNEPWERVHMESAKAFEAFVFYRSMKPWKRTVKEAAKQMGITVPRAHGWSSRFSWIARVAAYDAMIEQKRREAHIRSVQRMHHRHADAALQVIGLGLRRLLGRTDSSGKRVDNLKLEDMSAADVLRFIVEGAKLERLARGEPETVTHATIDQAPSEERLIGALAELEKRFRAESDPSESSPDESGDGGVIVSVGALGEGGTEDPES